MKKLGVNEILSFSACGSLNKKMKPGDFVLVDQYIDNTKHRASSFFGKGLVAHVPFGNPNCKRVHTSLGKVFKYLDIPAHFAGTYLAMEGPQFSSRSESLLYKDVWGCQVIGMTNMPEAKLAREAEICYQTVAMVTDFDCWNTETPHVTLEEIKKIFDANLAKMQDVISQYFRQSSNMISDQNCKQGCNNALDGSIVTHKEYWDNDRLKKLNSILNRFI
jgi:5'-methylthioadenosine phosphorylase